MNYQWDWSIYTQMSPEGTGTYGMLFLYGLGWTILTTIVAWIIAFSVGSLMGILRTLPSKTGNVIATAWVEVFRNIPMLVQLFLWYYVFPEILPKVLGQALKTSPVFFTVAIGLGFATSARIAEHVRAGIGSLPRGQKMAATAMGLTTYQSYRYVILPMAYRVMFPPLTSEFLNLVKNTSVGLTIGLVELTSRARSMQEYTFKVFEAFAAATVLYLLLNLIVVTIARLIERNMAVPGYLGARN
jgi:glutamate/aspartate transport system permease protein